MNELELHTHTNMDNLIQSQMLMKFQNEDNSTIQYIYFMGICT